MEFDPRTKPREIFVYTCAEIAKPFLEQGFKYRKSKNDLVKKSGDFTFSVYFQPSIKYGSTIFSVHVDVESERMSQWRAERIKDQPPSACVFHSTLARLTKREDDFPHYWVRTSTERCGERFCGLLRRDREEQSISTFCRRNRR